MDFFTIIITALALSMDSFSVAIALGCEGRCLTCWQQFRVALVFAFFQSGMPLIGWLGGSKLATLIKTYDHWVVLALLGAIGGKMIYESFGKKECTMNPKPLALMVVVGLALATSIDALAVGIGFALLQIPMVTAVVIIGVVTLTAVVVGIRFGNRLGPLFGSRVELIGGLVLIGIGLKILVEHLINHV